jgi:hypothetical protein
LHSRLDGWNAAAFRPKELQPQQILTRIAEEQLAELRAGLSAEEYRCKIISECSDE